jgi:hypothetical protein
MPDPGWPAPPAGWEFWTVVDERETPRFGMPPRTTAATYGTDRGGWLSGLRARATVAVPGEALAEPTVDAQPRAVGDAWQLDGLLTSAGR